METRLTELLPDNYKPGFVFVVVQKRINTKILGANRRGNQYEFVNPPPGTVLDHSVTRLKYKDFFLVPQSVNQGTVSPTHFIVLKEQLRSDAAAAAAPVQLDATGIQKLAYRLTHMYYNWPGTVRVPAPVQYAHKLVDLVGQHVHRVPAAQLSDKLFYL
jgi:aubergine-like protein